MRVYRDDEEHDLLLYMIGSGETCAIGLKCCMEGGTAMARAVADSNVSVLMVPVDSIHGLSVKYPEWFRYIIGTLNERIDRLFENIDDLAFGNLEQRILKYLRNFQSHGGEDSIKVTHQEIANDLNSSREVVSRVMKKLQQEGKLVMTRGSIKLV